MRKTKSGLLIEEESTLVFFGNRNSSIENLRTEFPQLSFARINQVHGHQVVESLKTQAADIPKEADAQITAESNLALCIVTADCLPILITAESSPWIGAIHAGWRGVAQNILGKTISTLLEKDVALNSLKIFIGPHIHMESYEVDENVKNQVIKSTQRESANHFQKLPNGKFLLGLEAIVCSQCLDIGMHLSQISFASENTKENLEYHSVRREKDTRGRQLNFICRTKAD